MKFTPAVFKAYDIRGLVPEEISPELAREIGRAFVDYLDAKTIAVGRDRLEMGALAEERVAEDRVAAGERRVVGDHPAGVLQRPVVAARRSRPGAPVD